MLVISLSATLLMWLLSSTIAFPLKLRTTHAFSSHNQSNLRLQSRSVLGSLLRLLEHSTSSVGRHRKAHFNYRTSFAMMSAKSQDGDSTNDVPVAQPTAISVPPGTSPVEQQTCITPINEQSTVLVVGASRGIGLEFVSQIMKKGAQVVATYRGPHVPAELYSFYQEEPDNPSQRRLHLLEMDVGDETSIENARSLFSSEGFPLLTHIVHSAGVYGPRIQLGDVRQQDMLDVYKINAIGPILVTQAFVPSAMRNQHSDNGGGAPIIAILTSKVGSIDDNSGGGGYLYRASKAAVNIVAKSLSIDLADQATVLLLHPGYVRTDMTGGKGLIDKQESVTGMLKAIEATGNSTAFRWVDYKACLIPW